MARVFISHSSRDNEPAGLLHAWLVEDGHEVFLDRDLQDGISVGEEWEQRLHERLRWADAVVCVVSAAYLASVWCTAEVGIARSRGCRLLPVRVAREVSHPLLKAVQHVDLTKDRGVAREKLVEALRRVDAAGGVGWPDGRSPYPGLRPFDTDQRQAFFGRATEIEQLVSLLRSPAERAEAAVLLVVGPSGCGKSSLVRAGLLPTVAEEPDWWVLPAFVPGADPLAALVRELAGAARDLGLDWTLAGVRGQLESVGLTELAGELLLRAGGRPRRLLVTVDQFEELLTQVGAEQRGRFAAVLGAALGGPVQVVATLRPEFLAQVLASPQLAGLPTSTYSLRPLTSEALGTVVERPARLAGIEVPGDLVARLVADTDGGEALPLLAYTLSQLAEGVPRGGQLLTSRYEQLGGVAGALARQADLALADAMTVAGHGRDRVITELLQLVTVDEEGRPTRRRVDRAELDPTAVAELDAFVARRLLTTDTAGDGTAVVSVAHEAFLRAWPPLAEAIAAASTGLRARRGIEQAATSWVEARRPPTRLWDGGQLAAALADVGAHVESAPRRPSAPDRSAGSEAASVATPAGSEAIQVVESAEPEQSARPADRADPAPRRKRWLLRRPRVLVTDRVQLSRSGRHFLLASIRRDRLRRGRTTAVLSVLLVLALIAAGVAFVERNNAQDQQRLATARLLLGQAEAARAADPLLAMRLGVAAHHVERDPQTVSSLVDTVASTRFAHRLPLLNAATAVSYAPDGTLVIGDAFGAVQLWNLTDPGRASRVGEPFDAGVANVTSAMFVPASAGRLLAVAGATGSVALWDVSDRPRPRRIGLAPGFTDGVQALGFTPDGRLMAGAGWDGRTVLWDIGDASRPRQLSELTGHADEVWSVVFSPDGHTLATGGLDKSVLLWDVTDPLRPRRIGELPKHADRVLSVAFAPSGGVLAVGGGENVVTLWNVTDATRPQRLGEPIRGHAAAVSGLVFAPDGRTLVSASYDATLLLWDVSDPARPRSLGRPLTGHAVSVLAAAFAPDGRTLASASLSVHSPVLLWDLADQTLPRRPLTELGGEGNGLDLAEGGTTLATAGGDGAMSVWDLTDLAAPRALTGPTMVHGGAMHSVVFAPGGRTMATSGDDRRVVLWDVGDPAQPRRLGELEGYPGEIWAVRFTPDGRMLAMSGEVGVLMWDVTEPGRARRLGEPVGGEVRGLAFAPGAPVLAAAGNQGLLLWDVSQPSQLRPLASPRNPHAGYVMDVAFASDGRMLATASADGGVGLWDLTMGASSPRGLAVLPHRGVQWDVEFDPGGRTLAVGGEDGTVSLWDLTDPGRARRLGQPLTGHLAQVNSLVFAADGHTLVTAGDDRSVLLWDLTGLEHLRSHALERACSLAGRGLNREEWHFYIPGLPFEETCPGQDSGPVR